MQQIRKLGSMSKIMGMLPGMGQFRDQLENFDEREIDRIQAIIQSMTPAERDNPKIIDGSGGRASPEGSGRQVSDVNQLVDRFFEARKMMQQMAAAGDAGMPGMPGCGAGGAASAAGQQAPKKAQGQARLRQPRQGGAGGAAPRLRSAKAAQPRSAPGEDVDYEKAAAALDLPKDFSKFLK
jgi:signal recognition particle subunit SRP54